MDTVPRRLDEYRIVYRAAANVRILFVGKVTYNKSRASRNCDYGWQENLGSSRV